MTKFQLAAGTILSAALLQASVAIAQTDTPNRETSSVVGLEPIVVTARRREESMQTTPISVTAITPAELERNNVFRPSDFTRVVANLTTNPQISFGTGVVAFIRGIGSTESSLAVDQPVALYRDGVYLGHSSTAGNTELLTLERVEVLRGPQGTLFGRNTSGGAINMITRDPRSGFGAEQRLRYGSFNEFLSATTVDTGDIAQTGVAATLSYEHHQRDGYVNDPTQPADRKPGAYSSNTVFAKVKGGWGKFNLTYTFDLFDPHSVPDAFQVVSVAPGVAAYYANSPSYGGAPFVYGPARMGTLTQPAIPEVNRNRVFGHALLAQADVADALTLKSISAWRTFDGSSQAFGAGPGGLLGRTLTSGGAAVPVPLVLVGPKRQRMDQFSEEIQALGTVGSFNYIVGGFYFIEHGGEFNIGHFTVPLAPKLAFPATSTSNYSVNNDSKAGYGQVSYNPAWIDDRLELTGGVRYTSDHKHVNENDALVRQGDKTFNNTTYAVSVKYQWTPRTMTFGRVGTGVRSGGFNIRAGSGQSFLFLPERATSYEVGVKSQFFDNRVRLDAGAFYTKYRDLQVTTITSDPQGGLSGATYNANATYRGGEVELTVAPTEGLTISGNVGYVDPKYSEIFFLNPVTRLPQNYASTSRFPYVAKVNANLDVTYQLPVSIGTLVADLNCNYQGKRYFAINTIKGQNPLADSVASPAHSILNGRLSLADISVGPTKAEVSVWVENITDKFYRVAGLDFGALNFAGAIYNAPRTVGVDVRAKY